jgi:hypothetical protein
MLDHDTDAYEKISSAFVDGQPFGGLTQDHVLDNISLYWLTGTGASAARSYWESGRAQARAAGQAPPPVSLPVGFTTFPGEIFRAPRSWVEQGYPSLSYFNEVDKGGHFAAWEEPELFATEIRAAFKPLRCRRFPCSFFGPGSAELAVQATPREARQGAPATAVGANPPVTGRRHGNADSHEQPRIPGPRSPHGGPCIQRPVLRHSRDHHPGSVPGDCRPGTLVR